ncbi:hypothetical protein QIS74_01221, partial [Colletotrichum tabaci]
MWCSVENLHTSSTLIERAQCHRAATGPSKTPKTLNASMVET